MKLEEDSLLGDGIISEQGFVFKTDKAVRVLINAGVEHAVRDQAVAQPLPNVDMVTNDDQKLAVSPRIIGRARGAISS